MIRVTSANGETMLRRLRVTTLASGAVAGLALLVIGFLAFRTQRSCDDAVQALGTTRKAIADAESLVQQAAGTPVAARSETTESATRFRAALQRIAKFHRCSVIEFQAAPEVQPFITRFANDTNVQGWSQVDVMVSIRGSVRDAVATLADLASNDVPFELSSIEITRDAVSPNGDATVIVRTQLRVLLRKGDHQA